MPSGNPVIAAICWWVMSSKKASCSTVRIRGGSRVHLRGYHHGIYNYLICRRRRHRGAAGPPGPIGDVALPESGREPVGDLPAGDADQPAAEAAPGRVERGSSAPGPHEHLLGDVLGVVVGGQTAQRDAVDRAAMPVEGLAQRRRVTRGEPVVERVRRARTRWSTRGPPDSGRSPGRASLGHRRFFLVHPQHATRGCHYRPASSRPGRHPLPCPVRRGRTSRRLGAATTTLSWNPPCPPVELATACDQGQPGSAVSGEQAMDRQLRLVHAHHLGDPVAQLGAVGQLNLHRGRRRPARPAGRRRRGPGSGRRRARPARWIRRSRPDPGRSGTSRRSARPPVPPSRRARPPPPGRPARPPRRQPAGSGPVRSAPPRSRPAAAGSGLGTAPAGTTAGAGVAGRTTPRGPVGAAVAPARPAPASQSAAGTVSQQDPDDQPEQRPERREAGRCSRRTAGSAPDARRRPDAAATGRDHQKPERRSSPAASRAGRSRRARRTGLRTALRTGNCAARTR